VSFVLATLILSLERSLAFVPVNLYSRSMKTVRQKAKISPSSLQMGMDLVTYLRTEWIAAALCTNQTPRSADTCLQLGTEDGRIVSFVPRTIRQIITSSAEVDGTIPIGARRQLKKNEEIRRCAKVKIIDQPADNLFDVEDNSVDIVISMQCAQRMIDNGRDWKKSVREACRVLKPGGRLLWIEQTTLNGENFATYLENLYTQTSIDNSKSTTTDATPEGTEATPTLYPTFEDIGWDDIDLVLIPHTAGVAVKANDPSLVETEEAKEKARLADLSITAFERGIKKRKKKKNKEVEKKV
jgi:SAM-dependent methyltransferase